MWMPVSAQRGERVGAEKTAEGPGREAVPGEQELQLRHIPATITDPGRPPAERCGTVSPERGTSRAVEHAARRAAPPVFGRRAAPPRSPVQSRRQPDRVETRAASPTFSAATPASPIAPAAEAVTRAAETTASSKEGGAGASRRFIGTRPILGYSKQRIGEGATAGGARTEQPAAERFGSLRSPTRPAEGASGDPEQSTRPPDCWLTLH